MIRIIFMAILMTTAASAQEYELRTEVSQFEQFRIPNPVLDQYGNPMLIIHEKWQFHSGVVPACSFGPAK